MKQIKQSNNYYESGKVVFNNFVKQTDHTVDENVQIIKIKGKH